jgi:hypothetical protein
MFPEVSDVPCSGRHMAFLVNVHEAPAPPFYYILSLSHDTSARSNLSFDRAHGSTIGSTIGPLSGPSYEWGHSRSRTALSNFQNGPTAPRRRVSEFYRWGVKRAS